MSSPLSGGLTQIRTKLLSKMRNSRHCAEWRLSLFAILIVTVKLNGWNVIVMGTRFTPFRVV